jgi:hypothetical protein
LTDDPTFIFARSEVRNTYKAPVRHLYGTYILAPH